MMMVMQAASLWLILLLSNPYHAASFVVPTAARIPIEPIGSPVVGTRKNGGLLYLQGDAASSFNDQKNTMAVASSPPSSSSSSDVAQMQQCVEQLKRTLTREYLSFFNPMERDYYDPAVSFIDPLTTLSGVASYQANVDMLSGRNWFGSLLFRDASISLHNVQGGEVTTTTTADDDGGRRRPQIVIGELTTRWTLRFTFAALPWRPAPRFSGISLYTVKPGGPKGVMIVQQRDYWDAINLEPGGTYRTVGRGEALQHLIGQMVPGALEAPAAGPELPYQTLRLAKSYEVRRYPSYTAVRMAYERRDEAFSAMGAVTAGTLLFLVSGRPCWRPVKGCLTSIVFSPSGKTGLGPMAPAVFRVNANGVKTMDWPIAFANPGDDATTSLRPPADLPAGFTGVLVPESVVAIARFGDAIVEPVVRRVDAELRRAVARDGLGTAMDDESLLTFAQYDAVFSMGQRRSEVHVALASHPW
jgi:hypothetical protein